MYRDGILIEEPGYITDKITDYGLDFIEKVHNADQPFFLNLSYTAPIPLGTEKTTHRKYGIFMQIVNLNLAHEILITLGKFMKPLKVMNKND